MEELKDIVAELEAVLEDLDDIKDRMADLLDDDERINNACDIIERSYLNLVNAALEDVIKGVAGNLGLTPLYEVASEMTELLRAGKDIDYSIHLKEILHKRDVLIKMRDS